MTVSVVIPVYNGEKYIPEMYRSLKRQTFRDFEILFVNDGSGDRSLELLTEIAKEDLGVVVCTQENRGICASRNLGIEKAKGTYLIFLDQDDGIEDNLIEKYVEAVSVNKADMASFGKTHYFVNDNQVTSIVPQLIGEELVTDRKRILECLFNLDNQKRLMTIWNCIYRRDLIQKYGLRFDEHFKHGDEDGMFNIEYTLHCERIFFSKDSYYHYYIRNGLSTITKYNEELLDNYLYYADKVCGLVSLICEESMLSIVKLCLLRFFSNVYGRFCRFHDSREEKISFLRGTENSPGFLFAVSLNVHGSRDVLPAKYLYWDLFNALYRRGQYLSAVRMLDFLLKLKKRKRQKAKERISK